MANSEDYLDSLLNSVQTVRKDVTDAQKQTEAILREKQEQRNRIKPDDDFMEASGSVVSAGNRPAMKICARHCQKMISSRCSRKNWARILISRMTLYANLKMRSHRMNWNTKSPSKRKHR